MSYERLLGTLLVSDDPEKLDTQSIYRYLHDEAYWCRGLPETTFWQSLEHSLSFGAYLEGEQVGYTRVVTDRATFAYLCDVFVFPAYQAQGYGSLLLQGVLAHPDLQNIRRWHLVTKDAQSFYAKFGFEQVIAEKHLERVISAATLYGGRG